MVMKSTLCKVRGPVVHTGILSRPQETEGVYEPLRSTVLPLELRDVTHSSNNLMQRYCRSHKEEWERCT